MKTVFIIGAGASSEVKLPVGTELKKHIANSLRPYEKGGSDAIWEALDFLTTRDCRPRSFTSQELRKASAHICDAMYQAISIDNFLDVHANDEAIVICGKLAIVHSILQAESRSMLFVERSTRAKLQFGENMESTWFNGFMQLLTEGCRKSNLKERLSSIVLIIFNYDRCVEHYIYHALQNYYGMESAEAAELIRDIDIYHPYGTVGSLPCLHGNRPNGFGEIPHASNLPALATEINTFTEGTDEESSEILAIREHVNSAERSVFLGFAFHRINMQLLLGAGPLPSRMDREIFATTMGISTTDSRRLVDTLSTSFGMMKNHIFLNNMTCRDLFKEHWRGLAYVR